MAAFIVSQVSSCVIFKAPVELSSQDISSDKFSAQGSLEKTTEVTLTILSLNDLHGGGLSVNQNFQVGTQDDLHTVDIGGPAAIKAYFEEVRRTNPAGALILDAGDSYQGSLVSNSSRGQAVSSLYSFIGVDASTIGNHEFDCGGISASTEEQQVTYDSPFLRIVENSNHHFLAHNMSFRDRALEDLNDLKDRKGVPYNIVDNAGQAKLASYAMFERNGVKVVVIGGITETAMQSSSPSHYRDVAIRSIGEGLAELIQDRRSKQGAQVVALLMHAGSSCDFKRFDYLDDQKNTSALCPGNTESDEIRAIFKRIESDGYQPKALIDMVVAGHVHAPQAHDYSDVPVIQNSDKGLGFGRVDIQFSHSTNAVVARKIFAPELFCHQHFQNYPGCNSNGPSVNLPYPTTLGNKILPSYGGVTVDIESRSGQANLALAKFNTLFGEKNEQITNLKFPLVHDRFKESVMVRCYVDSISSAADADLMIAISGGIRESLPQGPINAGDIFEVAPFDGGAIELRMSGNELMAYIAINNKDFSAKSMPIISAGWKLKVSREAPGEKVKPPELFELDSETSQWQKPDSNREYKVVVSAYLFENIFFDKYRSDGSKVIQSERELLTAALSADDQPKSCASPAGAYPNVTKIERCNDGHADSRWCGLSTECPL